MKIKIPDDPGTLLALAVAAAIVHNLGSAALGFEEPVFFMLTIVLGLGAMISAIKKLWK